MLNHFNVSICKSVVRTFAGAALALGYLFWAGFLFIVAELFGVIEEFVDRRLEE